MSLKMNGIKDSTISKLRIEKENKALKNMNDLTLVSLFNEK